MKRVYVVMSLIDNIDYLVFGTKSRAEKFIKNFNPTNEYFVGSKKEDLFISSRIVF